MNDRRMLAGNRKIWVIKAGFPNNSSKKQWSDYVFANTMKKYLERLGHYVVVESRDEWENEEPADVVISLRGPYAYYPDRSRKNCIYIMWNLSHPSTITDEEYNLYDLVCVGSVKEDYLQEVQKRTHVPVKSLPMCVDTEIFYPDKDPFGDKEYEWVFVGNSRYKERKSVSWAIEHQIPLKIWGAGWKNFIPDSEKYVVDENIPNNELPHLYWNAKITIDDHYEDMINNGFINTRIVEALACGLPIISDYSEVLREMFGDAILCYRNEEEFVQQTERLDSEYKIIKEKTMSLWPLIEGKYSFESCMIRLSELKDEIVEYGNNCKEDVRFMCCGEKALRENRVGVYYREWKSFLGKLMNLEEQAQGHPDKEDSTEQYCMDLEKEKQDLGEQFCRLTWQEQEAFGGLTGIEQFWFKGFVQDEIEYKRKIEELDRIISGLKSEQEKLQTELGKSEKIKEELEKKRIELVEKIRKVNDQKREINEKLQKTYAEKSEINRKLQITYGEKYDRGLEIKRLKKELESIKKSRSYKLARMIGFPVRLFRIIVKKIKPEQDN